MFNSKAAPHSHYESWAGVQSQFPPFFREIFSFLMKTSNFYFIFHEQVLMTYSSMQSIFFPLDYKESELTFPTNQRSQLNKHQQVFPGHFHLHTPFYQCNLIKKQTKKLQKINHYDIPNSSTTATRSQTPKDQHVKFMYWDTI